MNSKTKQGAALISRRTALFSGLGAAGFFALGADAQNSVFYPGDLSAGQFIWMPEVAPSGAVAIVVSLTDQLVHVYRGGIRIGVSTCSTGTKGHKTPTGVFTILEKDKDHYSNLYDNAPMPNMNRLTWTGIALHAGNLPGYPASHGCIRLPMTFSENLYKITHVGTPVIIAGTSGDPWNLSHPGVTLTNVQSDQFSSAVDDLKRPPSDWSEARKNPVMTLIASSADRRIEMLENGRLIDQSELFITGVNTLGEHVLMLDQTPDGSRLGWADITKNSGRGTALTGMDAALRIRGNDDFTRRLIPRQHAGVVLIITDYPLSPERRSAPDFRILTS